MNKAKKLAAIIISSIIILGGGITAGVLLGGGSDKDEISSNGSVPESADSISYTVSDSSDNVSDSSDESDASSDDSDDPDTADSSKPDSSAENISSAPEDEIPEGSTGEYDLVTYDGVEYKLYKMDSYEYEFCWVYDENIPIEAYHLDTPDTDPKIEDYIWNYDIVPDYTYKMYEEIADKTDTFLKLLCTWDGINGRDKARELAEKITEPGGDVEETYNNLLNVKQEWCFDGKLMYDLHFVSAKECYVNYAYKCLAKTKDSEGQPDATACVITYGDLYFTRINGEWQITENKRNNDIPFKQYYFDRNEYNEPMFYQRESVEE